MHPVIILPNNGHGQTHTYSTRPKIGIGCLHILSITPHPSFYVVEMEVQVFWYWLLNALSASVDYFVARKSGLRSRSFTVHTKTFHHVLKLHRPCTCNTYNPLNQLTNLVVSTLNSYKYLLLVFVCMFEWSKSMEPRHSADAYLDHNLSPVMCVRVAVWSYPIAPMGDTTHSLMQYSRRWNDLDVHLLRYWLVSQCLQEMKCE